MKQELKIEVKTDFLVGKTGNLCIEYHSRGKSSGIMTSKADYWAFVLPDHDKSVVLIQTRRLLKLCVLYGTKKIGGDNNTSKIYLLPIKKVFEEVFIK